MNPILTGSYDFDSFFSALLEVEKDEVDLQNNLYMYETINKNKWCHISGLFEFVIDSITTS